ncbi:MAG: helix-turn-helix transcriptional regulator [Rhizobiaceae bacterium]|nr:helix-turn-helix transcriptional regulator [Rhizobiaceae bacterium]MCV0408592.1 helix-turn-helix transcriptional regulator [Rhizobiaceae bacterium]
MRKRFTQGGTFLTQGHPDVTATHDLDSPSCKAVSSMLSRIGDKWTVLVVELLSDGPMRFTELMRAIGGISQKMLTTTLRGLERDGFVRRTVTPTIPPRVDYELTELGRELQVPVRALGTWARENMARVEAARDAYDAANSGT